MDFDTIMGVMLVVMALLGISALVWWSRWSINRIANKKLESARDIIRDLRHVG